MNSKNAKIGNYYRHKDTLNYGWAKILDIQKPKKSWNTSNYICAKCEWSVHKNDTMGFIKSFKLSDLVEERN